MDQHTKNIIVDQLMNQWKEEKIHKNETYQEQYIEKKTWKNAKKNRANKKDTRVTLPSSIHRIQNNFQTTWHNSESPH